MSKAQQAYTGKAKGMVRSKHEFFEQDASASEQTTRHVRLKAIEDGLTGYVEDNGEKVAFSLIPKSRDYDLRWLLDQTAPGKEGK